jgi:hypothetical protein
MQKAPILKLAATLSFAGMIVINVFANAMPINGLTTGEVSDLYPSLFTPAGITFSIWSVIYLLLTAFIVYTWTRDGDRVVEFLPGFILTSVLNATWIVVWHFLLPEISVLIMIALLVTLIRLFLQLSSLPRPALIRVVVIAPFTLYLAWICVATIANISALFVAFNWDGGFISEEVWTLIMMSVATALGLGIMTYFRTPEFGLVVAWALIGIFLRWQNTENMIISYGAICLAGAILIGVGYQIIRKRIT